MNIVKSRSDAELGVFARDYIEADLGSSCMRIHRDVRLYINFSIHTRTNTHTHMLTSDAAFAVCFGDSPAGLDSADFFSV